MDVTENDNFNNKSYEFEVHQITMKPRNEPEIAATAAAVIVNEKCKLC